MNFLLYNKPSGQDRTAAERNYVAEATRRRRRILQAGFSLNIYLELGGPLRQIPDLSSQAFIEFRLMADHQDTSLVLLQGSL